MSAKRLSIGLLVVSFVVAPTLAHSAVFIPGSADSSRIPQREEKKSIEPPVPLPSKPYKVSPAVKAPSGTQGVTITLNEVRITGMTVFKTADIRDIYLPYLGREVSLDTVWVIAGQLTERYHNAGYFLSRVVVPQQEIKKGIVNLRVMEGYIGAVKFDHPLAYNPLVKKWVAKIPSFRPINTRQIESVLLQLNDIPGVNVRAVIEPMEAVEKTEGTTLLVLEPREEAPVAASITFDNSGSRFLGPYEAQAQAQFVFGPGQRTTVSVFSSLPWDEVKYGSLKHEISVFPRGSVEVYGSYTKSAPGDTLEALDIRSQTKALGTAFNYSMIRQRDQNLSGKIVFEGQDTSSDIMGTALTRDAVRALRLGLNFNGADPLNGEFILNGTVSQGLSILGASKKGDSNLSNDEATPDFTKFNVDFSRVQNINENWNVLTAASGQIASGPLFSSEQFGYGGQTFGRAYDFSEIIGDQGISALAEIRYTGLRPWHGVQTTPYGFYDIGAIWNEGVNPSVDHASGSSTGAGIRFLSEVGLSGNFGIAFPLSRPIANPLFGNGKNPRYIFQISYGL